MSTSEPETVEDALMGVDALDEDPLGPMGEIMRMVSRAVVTAVSVGSWTPKPIAERILQAQDDELWSLLDEVTTFCEYHGQNCLRTNDLAALIRDRIARRAEAVVR